MRLRTLAIAGALVAGVVIKTGLAQAPKPDPSALAKSGILERLAERTGIYGVPPTAKVPGFIADTGWPQKSPAISRRELTTTLQLKSRPALSAISSTSRLASTSGLAKPPEMPVTAG